MVCSRTRSHQSDSTRAGFTLIEVLVVIGVIGVLVVLLLPAVQYVRQASDKTQCASNLHQLGVAVANYESLHGVFPGAYGLSGSFFLRGLAPFAEIAVEAERNPLLACPQDELATGQFNGGVIRWNYLLNDGLYPIEANGFARTKPMALRYVTPADITDGLSATAAFAERLTWPSTAPSVSTAIPKSQWIRYLRQTTQFKEDYDEFFEECDQNAQRPFRIWFRFLGYNHVMTPNRNSCVNGGPDTHPSQVWRLTDYMAMTASSQHGGGVNVLFADGRVKYVADQIDRAVWRALGTRDGRESVDLSSF